MNRFKGTKGSIILILLVMMVVAYFYYLNNRTMDKEENLTEASEVQIVLSRDLTWNYPSTPKEVLKYYNEVISCFYNETYSDEELEQLADQARKMYDSELVANQTEEEYLEQLKSDIDEMKEKKYTIMSWSISASTDVEFFSQDNFEWARLYCSYTLKGSSANRTTNQVYLLRKDDEGHWKIYGWDLVTNVK